MLLATSSVIVPFVSAICSRLRGFVRGEFAGGSQIPDSRVDAGLVVAHPVGENEPDNAGEDGVETDQPDDGEGARPRTDGNQHAKRNGEQAGQPERPAPPDLSAELDTGHHPEDAGGDAPCSYQHDAPARAAAHAD